MKKEFNKIVAFIGFLTTLVGLWIGAFITYAYQGLNLVVIAVILAFAFINASNNVLKIVGYSLNVVLGAIGINAILIPFNVGTLVASIGMMIMTLATLIYFVMFVLSFFGFVKAAKDGGKDAPCLWNELGRYKEMLTDGILTQDEFTELKQKAMENANVDVPSIDDLKKWKKLLDQQVITEDEFASIKKNIFAK